MTYPLFLNDQLGSPLMPVGSSMILDGDEGRHAAVVKRITVGEMIMVADGRGAGVLAQVSAVAKTGLQLTVTEHLSSPTRGARYVAVQALAKGDRSELAVEMLTEVGVETIIPWQAARSIVRWSGERAAKSLLRWQSTVREATKQSRRLRIPEVVPVVSTRELCTLVGESELALILHEDAGESLSDIELPDSGTILIIIGPEGGITSDELASLSDAGATPVTISDGVVRTSTAGVVALSGLLLRPAAQRQGPHR